MTDAAPDPIALLSLIRERIEWEVDLGAIGWERTSAPVPVLPTVRVDPSSSPDSRPASFVTLESPVKVAFVGDVGEEGDERRELLWRIIDAMGLARTDVSLHPLFAPAAAVAAAVAARRPQVTIALGDEAARALIGAGDGTRPAQGTFVEGTVGWVLATFGPSDILADARRKRPVWDHMRRVMERLSESAGTR